MPFDFNNASEQKEGGLIPTGTLAPVHMTIRPGASGEGGWLKRSRAGDSMMLDCEFTVTEGPFAKRKFWTLMTVEGVTEGQQKAADISASRIRGILESARGIRPDDESPAGKSARQISSWGDLNNIRFLAKIGVEIGKGEYKGKDKNTLDFAVTPDRQAWQKIEQVAQQSSFQPIGVAASNVAQAAAAAPVAGKPSWAQ